MSLTHHARLLGLALTLSMAGATLAHAAACPPGVPPGVDCGGPDFSPAAAGIYKIDPDHAAVIARVSHIGYSLSVFRFGGVAGSMTWDPAAPEAAKLSVTVQTASIATPVKGFAAELSGPAFLNAAKFPTATFVSTAFHKTDPTHGKVDGQFTLLGKTHPVTFDVALVGAGKGFGQPRMGVTARAMINPQDYGMAPTFVAPIELVVDVEFARQP